MNEYLKEIGQLMESMQVTFDKERTKGGALVSVKRAKWEYLTTHTARRSFATNMFKRGNIPVQLIMAITSHKTETQFYKYIKMEPSDKADMFRKLAIGSNNMRAVK